MSRGTPSLRRNLNASNFLSGIYAELEVRAYVLLMQRLSGIKAFHMMDVEMPKL